MYSDFLGTFMACDECATMILDGAARQDKAEFQELINSSAKSACQLCVEEWMENCLREYIFHDINFDDLLE